MKRRDIFNFIYDVQREFRENDRWYYINSGGCGCFAYGIGLALQTLKLPVVIRFANYELNEYNTPLEVLRTNNHPTTMSEWNAAHDGGERNLNGHVVAQFTFDGQDYVVDSCELEFASRNEVPTYECMDFHPDSGTLLELRGMLQEQDGWNSMFDVVGELPAVVETIREIFNRHF